MKKANNYVCTNALAEKYATWYADKAFTYYVNNGNTYTQIGSGPGRRGHSSMPFSF